MGWTEILQESDSLLKKEQSKTTFAWETSFQTVVCRPEAQVYTVDHEEKKAIWLSLQG